MNRDAQRRTDEADDDADAGGQQALLQHERQD